jgi:hypothetical protein
MVCPDTAAVSDFFALENVGMYFVVDSDREVAPQQATLIWRRLWEMRDLVPISAVLPAVVTSPCALLPDEDADATLVATLTQVPAESAWISCEIDLVKFLRRDGELRFDKLDPALEACVVAGERRHDETRWVDPNQNLDSWLNRRLSVFVRGWGDLVARRGDDPTALATLRELDALLKHVCQVLKRASRSLAESNGYCPALDVAGARVLQHGHEMNARWRQAVTDNALRHRNLLTLSPWDAFPRNGRADFRFMNLLPAIRHAHSVSMHREADISFWSARDFKAFHERVSAILRRCSEAPLVARQV